MVQPEFIVTVSSSVTASRPRLPVSGVAADLAARAADPRRVVVVAGPRSGIDQFSSLYIAIAPNFS